MVTLFRNAVAFMAFASLAISAQAVTVAQEVAAPSAAGANAGPIGNPLPPTTLTLEDRARNIATSGLNALPTGFRPNDSAGASALHGPMASGDLTRPSSAVPEPRIWIMLWIGLSAIGIMTRRRKQIVSA